MPIDDVPDHTAELVLAALSGQDDLAAVLDGGKTSLDLAVPSDEAHTGRIWLSSVTVAGFRGVGPERTLQIAPGPGLTLVVGRNGSGKSSFAEAVELALTGDSARWAERNSVWRTGWRNLHSPDPCWIVAQLHVDGEAKPVTATRSWPLGAALADAEVTVTSERGRHWSLAQLGLARPLERYRPFLTAAELSRLTDASQRVLPRGCAPESPFRFIVADEPERSIGSATVDGLARVLAALAVRRQVVVFTHDVRLPEAVHRLGPGRVRIVEVTRAQRSVVTLRPASDL
ncbi:AAA family ATPase [Micromonospora sp. NPDC048868]|uniref:AAA family ATPase n=1 Tax=Micromonospora sp. NPDC048868 TaxID=3364258 RepID=UPI00371BCF42